MTSYSVCSFLCLVVYLFFLKYRAECCFYNMIHHAVAVDEGDPPKSFGDPLYLTPMLKRGDKKMARYYSMVGELPHVDPAVATLKSYSGFLTVNQTYGSNLFFWFFPAMQDEGYAPVVIWLQGGPGFSSLIGVFAENGPLKYNHARGDVSLRDTTWIKTMNVLYIDSPVGSGFSHTNHDKGYVQDQSQIIQQLMEAIQQFFSIFDDYKSRSIYIAGEGYACKSIIPLANEFQSANEGDSKLNIEGIIVGNGMCDQFTFSDRSYPMKHSGLIDNFQAKELSERSFKIQNFISKRDFDKALKGLISIFKDEFSETSLFRNMTGYESLYDFTKQKIPEDLYIYTEYLAKKEVRRSLHVGFIPFDNRDKVCEHLTADLASSIQPQVLSNVFSKSKVLFYHGGRDLLVPYNVLLHFLHGISSANGINFGGINSHTFGHPLIENFNIFQTEGRVGKVSVGRVQRLGDNYLVILWNAGHFAAYDDPKTVHDVVENFIFEKPFNS